MAQVNCLAKQNSLPMSGKIYPLLKIAEVRIIELLKKQQNGRSLTAMETINLKIKRVSYVNPDNGYVVLKGKSRNRLVTAVGTLPEALDGGKLTGTEFEFTGNWEMSKFGRQFAFSKARIITNEVFYFLAKVVKGLGDKLARRLLEHYGEKELTAILEKNPEKLLEFKGCLLYTSDAADEGLGVDLGGRRIIKKKK